MLDLIVAQQSLQLENTELSQISEKMKFTKFNNLLKLSLAWNCSCKILINSYYVIRQTWSNSWAFATATWAFTWSISCARDVLSKPPLLGDEEKLKSDIFIVLHVPPAILFLPARMSPLSLVQPKRLIEIIRRVWHNVK